MINRTVAHGVSRTVAHGVLDKFWLFKKCGIFKAKRELRSLIWGQFRGPGNLSTLFFTSFGFLTVRANLKQNDGCAECFDANFEQQGNCALCFGQVLAFQQNSPILINRTLAHAVSYRRYLSKNTGQFKAKRQLHSVT